MGRPHLEGKYNSSPMNSVGVTCRYYAKNHKKNLDLESRLSCTVYFYSVQNLHVLQDLKRYLIYLTVQATDIPLIIRYTLTNDIKKLWAIS